MLDFRIGTRPIGPGQPVYLVAELSANHNRDFNTAAALVQAARDAGADAVKLQTYTPDSMTIRSDKEYFRIGGGTLWDGNTLYELYEQAQTPWDWQPRLGELARSLGLDLFSSAFDAASVDFLEAMNVPVHKVASFELVDIPLIEKMSRTGKPLILSTGMASLEEIQEAVSAAYQAGAAGIALLKCTSAYPAPANSMNLQAIPHLMEIFGVPVGLSDHTLGTTVPVAAVALGACIIEKHFTLSRSIPGPDSAFSLEPREFKQMVDAVRVAEQALQGRNIGAGETEAGSIVFRRSLFVVQDVRAGEMFTEQNVRSIRPAHGLPPRYYNQVIGKRAAQDIERGTPLTWQMIQPSGKDLAS